MVISSRKQITILMSSLYLHILSVATSGQINEASAHRLRDDPSWKEAGCVWRSAVDYKERYLTTIGSSDRLFF